MFRASMFLAIFLSGCAATSGVVPIGADTFLISRSEKGFYATGSGVKADAINEANKHCATNGKQAEILKTNHLDMVPFKSVAQAEIEFRCVASK